MENTENSTKHIGLTKGGHKVFSFEVLETPIERGHGQYPHMYKAEVLDMHPKQYKKVIIFYDTLGRCNNPLREDLYINLLDFVKEGKLCQQ